MISDLRKSFNEIIYERTTSPLYGTLTISWLIWNWRIIYLSFFVSEDKIEQNKIDYIISNYSDFEHVLIFPLISTFLLLTIVPFISNGAFWLSLKFNKWKVDQKNIVDKKQLLSIEQSVELREEISKQEERYSKLIESKNLEISQLNIQLQNFNEKNSSITPENILRSENSMDLNHIELQKLSERIKNNPKELQQYEKALSLIQGDYALTGRSDIDSKFIALLESYDIISSSGTGSYKFTSLGKKLQKLMLE